MHHSMEELYNPKNFWKPVSMGDTGDEADAEGLAAMDATALPADNAENK